MTRKAGTVDDYIKLGRMLCDTHGILTSALVTMSPMVRRESQPERKLLKLIDNLSELRSELDAQFFKDHPRYSPTEGQPKFPMYPGGKESR